MNNKQLQELKQEKAREVLMKYLNESPWRPEYDGMTAREVAGIILREAEKIEMEDTLNGMAAMAGEDHDCKSGCPCGKGNDDAQACYENMNRWTDYPENEETEEEQIRAEVDSHVHPIANK